MRQILKRTKQGDRKKVPKLRAQVAFLEDSNWILRTHDRHCTTVCTVALEASTPLDSYVHILEYV